MSTILGACHPLYFAIIGLVTLALFSLQQPGIGRVIWRRPAATLLIGILMGVMVFTHFIAIQKVEVAYMIAVKRTSLLFGILYGALLFQEQGLTLHLIAGSLMVAGIMLIVFLPMKTEAIMPWLRQAIDEHPIFL